MKKLIKGVNRHFKRRNQEIDSPSIKRHKLGESQLGLVKDLIGKSLVDLKVVIKKSL